MALTDLLKSFTRASAFGVALYACGGGEKTIYPCRTTADCTSGTCVGGYCESPSNNYSSGSLCEDACQTLRDCCDIVTGREKVDCEENDWNDSYCRQRSGVSCMERCVDGCEESSIPASQLRCLAELVCVDASNEIYKCGRLDW